MPSAKYVANILVVDDDENLRAMLSKALSAKGYKVTEASNGTAALNLYQKSQTNAGYYDLVVLDMNMPGMNGDECIERLLLIDNDARVVLSTGEIPENIKNHQAVINAVGVLAKPFSLKDLYSIIDHALEQ